MFDVSGQRPHDRLEGECPHLRNLNAGEAGTAGEYAVATELARRGFIVTLTQKNTAKVDLLVAAPRRPGAARIQVKTSSSANGPKQWVLGADDEQRMEELTYVMVWLGAVRQPPRFWVVSSEIVAQRIATFHQAVIAKGRKDVSMRIFRLKESDDREFEARWDRLNLGDPLLD